MIKNDAQRQFYRLPYLSDRGQGFYLDLLVLRSNARLKNRSIFYTFLKAIVMHENDPLVGYDPIIPVREDDEDEENEEEVEEDEEFEFEEDYWFVYPQDLTYEDDSDDADFRV